MAARLSIIIPTLNAEADLPATLDALLTGVAQGVIRELIVTDGGSQDATVILADDAGAEIVTGRAGRGGQLARGAATARGDWLLFVHADTHLPPGWVGAVCTHMDRCEGAAVFRLSFRASGTMAWVTAGWANLRTRLFGLPYGDQGLLISRGLYDAVGGFADLALMEDVAMARALKGRITVLDETVTTDAGRYVEGGWLRRGTRNLWALTRYLAGADPKQLAARYHKR
ncbi:TIGR04283 family arsenosugar biosynthesis glycosyltransferase [uncultured Litoreibacter sp.]|uniref:TIGR04283 family arsenosugar biosynthesis glycosyltransferase n=1 Tax=uncultured Litoreibacter sp. TaxID=1392394 RepID=UPI002602B2E5|nr:TIGR04283 family arsenosugar biosynthesis glycosyltransferase [uncultured Litoreibacter sp.]